MVNSCFPAVIRTIHRIHELDCVSLSPFTACGVPNLQFHDAVRELHNFEEEIGAHGGVRVAVVASLDEGTHETALAHVRVPQHYNPEHHVPYWRLHRVVALVVLIGPPR